MKPTSLSPEFYENLYNEIINHGFEPETENDCHCNMDIEDVDGFFVNLEATFEVNYEDDSFDHAFGTEYGYHFECGNLIDIEAVVLSDEDGNDVSDLFDYDAFWEQFKCYEFKLRSGAELKSGDAVLAGGYYVGRWSEMKFLYYDSLRDLFICVPVGQDDKRICQFSFPKVVPNTEENRKSLRIA